MFAPFVDQAFFFLLENLQSALQQNAQFLRLHTQFTTRYLGS